MATRKKAKGKGTAKRKKTPGTKAATRKKTTLARRTKTIRKKAPKKAPLRRASAKKAKPIAKAAVKPTPISPPAQVTAVGPTASPPAQPGPLDNDTATEGEQRRRQHVRWTGPRCLSLVHCWRDLFGHPGGKDHELDAARTGGVLKRLWSRRHSPTAGLASPLRQITPTALATTISG
jgi:hypothetical protein